MPHRRAEFRVSSSAFPEMGGAHRIAPAPPWHVHPAPLADGTPKRSHPRVGRRCPEEAAPLSLPVWPAASADRFRQGSTRRHVARATWHRPTRDRHHRRSGVAARPTVPRRSRCARPFGLQPPECLDTHTHKHTDKQARPTCADRPPRRCKSPNSSAELCSAPEILRFWTRGRHCWMHSLGPKS